MSVGQRPAGERPDGAADRAPGRGSSAAGAAAAGGPAASPGGSRRRRAVAAPASAVVDAPEAACRRGRGVPATVAGRPAGPPLRPGFARSCAMPAPESDGGWPPTFTTMSPNCSDVVEPAERVQRQLEACPAAAGGWPIRPAGASTFCVRIAAATSTAVISRAASFCGSSHARML